VQAVPKKEWTFPKMKIWMERDTEGWWNLRRKGEYNNLIPREKKKVVGGWRVTVEVWGGVGDSGGVAYLNALLRKRGSESLACRTVKLDPASISKVPQNRRGGRLIGSHSIVKKY